MLYDKKWDEKLPVDNDNFLSAKDLNIPEQERLDLIRVLGMFERGLIPTRLFDMRVVGAPQCGIPGCIIGWIQTFEEWGASYRGVDYKGLFSVEWADATPAQAGQAVRNFLTTGDHKWQEILHAV